MRKIHDFHIVKPRIVFETNEFSSNERIEAINLAKKEGYYSDSNDQDWLFDFGKELAMKIQSNLPDFISDKLYIFMKNVYRKRILNKITFAAKAILFCLSCVLIFK